MKWSTTFISLVLLSLSCVGTFGEIRTKQSAICPETVQCSPHQVICTIGNDNDCTHGICCRASGSSNRFGIPTHGCCVQLSLLEGSINTTLSPPLSNETSQTSDLFTTSTENRNQTVIEPPTTIVLSGNGTEESENATVLTTPESFTNESSTEASNQTTTDTTTSTELNGNATEESVNGTTLNTTESSSAESSTENTNQTTTTETTTTTDNTSTESTDSDDFTTKPSRLNTTLSFPLDVNQTGTTEPTTTTTASSVTTKRRNSLFG